MCVRNGLAALYLCVLLTAGFGCDATPGPASPDARAPVLSDFTYTPRQVTLEELPEDQVVDGRARIPLSLSVAAGDPEGQVDRVEFVVRSPFRGADPLAAGTLAPTVEGRYEAATAFEVPVCDVGTYSVLVYAVDADELVSNQVRGTVKFTAACSPPVLESVEAPDRIQRPGSGEPPRLVQIVAVVSDPDGLDNVSHVLFWNVARPAQTSPLLDDGSSESGDEVAGDGRYTAIVQVTSSNATGTNTLAFQAYDRAGFSSEVVEQQITVE